MSSLFLRRRSPHGSPDAAGQPPSSPTSPPRLPEASFQHGLTLSSTLTPGASPLLMPGAYRSGSPSRGPLGAPRFSEGSFATGQPPASPLLQIPGTYPLTPDTGPGPASPLSSYSPGAPASTTTTTSSSSSAPSQHQPNNRSSSSPFSPGPAPLSAYREAMLSPGLGEYATAPSTPEEQAMGASTEPPLDAYPFPNADAAAAANPPADFDMYDDDTLNTLEKIWLFSRSEATFHRVFIVHSLPDFLDDVTPTEAVDYVLPLVSSLAMDEELAEDAVKEALAAELVRIAWWFLTHCQVVDYEPGEGTENPTLLPVQAFTPILGTLLLCPSPAVATSSRRAVVELLSEIRKADEGEVEPGLFGEEERHLFRQELLESVVVGMARLDVSDRPSSSHSDARGPALQTQPQTNPYFPDVPAAPAASTPASRSAPGSPTLARNAQGVGGERAQGIPTTVVTDTDPAMTGQARGGSPADVRMTPSEDPDDASEQAAMGRLSSMSLMAAVTASGSVDDDARAEFVGEVTRAGRDPVYWVRREASFALGALAKVVPFEIVTGSLLPLFEALCHDPTWHVRHSALFAFPAILSRLQPRERRSLAMGIVFSLSADPAPAVQSGVLEALGEVIHSFRDDPGGPPYDLLRLFLGRPEDREFWKNRIRSLGLSPQPQAPPSDPTSPFAGSGTAFFDDPARPLICAFNFPAVTLTLGRDRWHELRDFYATLARSEVVKVRRSLAASAGEIAKIVGPENARRDVLPMWFEAVRSEEADLRLRAVECLGTLAQSLGPTERADLLVSLQRIWVDNLRGWRERETVAGSLDELVPLMGEKPGILRSLLLKALQDSVAAVRQAAINMVPKFCVAFGNRPTVIRDIHEDINRLARAPSYRYRMTFVACRQALVLAPGGESTLADSHFWKLIGQLADDQITNVRIGVARLLGIICDRFFSDASKMPSHIMDILVRVAHDESKEVQSYVSVHWDRPRNPVPSDLATFSRPPPTPLR